MVAKIYSATIIGVDAHPVEIETQVRGSTKRFVIIGLPDGVVKESKDRIRLAIENSGFAFPNREVVVSLGPATVPKRGAGFDLPIALSILSASGYLEPSVLKELLAMAELALDGRLKSVSGSLAASGILQPRQSLIVAESSSANLSLIANKSVQVAQTLSQVVRYLKGVGTLASPVAEEKSGAEGANQFSEVVGQHAAKRALEISAAGGHNSLLIGPPGAGKTMLASRLNSLLPPLTSEEEIEIRKIYDSANIDFKFRPFRAPHHTTSYAGLIGGGGIPSPGEITLAHKGVLFLDELPEFRRDVIETLRQPLEQKEVSISRRGLKVKFPADFILVAAMNPCPCGKNGLDGQPCNCSPLLVKRYLSRLSQAFLDRIDLSVHVKAIPVEKLANPSGSENDHRTVQRISNAREIQRDRSGRLNCHLQLRELKTICQLSQQAEKFMVSAAKRYDFSARGYLRTLRLSRTIADLSDSSKVETPHLAEAIRYRTDSRLLTR